MRSRHDERVELSLIEAAGDMSPTLHLLLNRRDEEDSQTPMTFVEIVHRTRVCCRDNPNESSHCPNDILQLQEEVLQYMLSVY